MKDFIKWLGVNEKIAKIAVWMLIFMVMLILTNTMLESLGFPHYAITYDNLIRMDINKTLGFVINCIICILNFYSVILLVFRVEEAKNIFKYSVMYMILNCIINMTLGYGILQIFIISFFIIFSYLYSNKNWKYIIFCIISIIANILIQGIWYSTKAQFINYPAESELTRSILSLDYFIIMAVIILVKEIYLKKRGEKNG